MSNESTSRPTKRVRHVEEGDAAATTASTAAGAVSSATTSTTAAAQHRKPRPASRIFTPFRVLGLVSNEVPFALNVQIAKGALEGPNVNIISCVGRSWLSWDGSKMNLLFAGSETPAGPITCLAVHRNDVFAGSGSNVYRYHRGKQVAVYEGSSEEGSVGVISKILLFGDQLIGLTEGGFIIWSIESLEVEGEVSFAPGFVGLQMLHPSTYVNKVIVGAANGDLALYNTRTLSLIHTFKCPRGLQSSPVTSLAQSPAIDVIAIGYHSGVVRIVDIKQDEQVMSLRMDNGAAVGLAFRMEGPPILAVSSSAGTIALFDLSKEGRVLHTLRDAHEGSVTGLQWVTGQPLLISSSDDNSIKQWVCDTDLALPRLLKSRSGHRDPVTCVRYLGEDGKQVLSASRDGALRNTSIVRDSRSAELSQGSLQQKAARLGKSTSDLKLPPILGIASASTRKMDFEDVVTFSQGEAYARSWRSEHKKIGRHAMHLPEGTVTAVDVSACGNFGVVGSSAGELAAFNLESGKQRRVFLIDAKSKPKKKLAGGGRNALRKSISGIALDSLNKSLVASTLDGTLYFFDFHTAQLLHTMSTPTGITRLQLQRDSGLLALLQDDGNIRLVDIETRKVVRELFCGRGRILDMTFSPDSRLITVTSLDCSIRTYDISTGYLVDRFRVPTMATSVAFSPTADFLATAHADSNGVFLWSNRLQLSDVPMTALDEDEVEIVESSLPVIDADVDDEEMDAVEAATSQAAFITPDQLSEDLVTLTLLPSSRWKTLLNLETIAQRNKPKAPPKVPEQAPFFLQAAPTSLDAQNGIAFDLPVRSEDERPAKSLRSDVLIESEFTRVLKGDESNDAEEFFRYVKQLSPAAIDFEIRSLLSLEDIEAFIRALTARLRSKRDIEAVEALMRVMLDVHSDVLIENGSELKEPLETLLAEHKQQLERVRTMARYALGTMAFLR